MAMVSAVVLAVLRRPGLWAVALRQLFRLAEPGWWTRAPFLPVPPRSYMHFRMVTAYGGDGAPASAAAAAADVVAYLTWCRAWGGAERSAPPR